MCLDKVFEKGKYPKFRQENGHKVASKVFRKRKGSLYRWIQGKRSKRFPVGVWVKSKDWMYPGYQPPTIQCGIRGGGIYEPGFHSYLDEADANRQEARHGSITDNHGKCARKVYYRGILVCGMQNGMSVIVSKEIFIVPKRARKE